MARGASLVELRDHYDIFNVNQTQVDSTRRDVRWMRQLSLIVVSRRL